MLDGKDGDLELEVRKRGMGLNGAESRGDVVGFRICGESFDHGL